MEMQSGSAKGGVGGVGRLGSKAAETRQKQSNKVATEKLMLIETRRRRQMDTTHDGPPAPSKPMELPRNC
jgi:hypothetical protein